MRIGELAGQTGASPKTIRYYESIGLLPEPARTHAGYRAYTEHDTDRLVFIKTAQRLGLRLDEIREILALRDQGERPCDYVRQTLRRQVNEINQHIADLRRLRDELTALDARADELIDTDTEHGCPLIERAHGAPTTRIDPA
ncbi:heavy metal-responsive transcriptional regulator [Haloechinothrix halophila]|uniref:heavy metal-responsive transcriptional regulator n=1 Tax=Haloechinothrix halophila TaxID=1069073 RepID=UPI0009FCA7E7|nr:heavy metal-responsive transcriptional regulator [Haloechinothrix halophila]